MPSVFEQLLAQQLPSMRDCLGIAGCTYTAPDGSVVTGLTLQVQRDEPRQVDRDVRVEGELQTGKIKVLQADLPNCVKGGRFSVPGMIGPEVWTIANSPVAQAGRFVCMVTRSSTERLMPRRQKE